MWHEQQRVDRDNYIKILKENIENPENNMVNYEKHNTANELPYDVESVLQYDLRVRICDVCINFVMFHLKLNVTKYMLCMPSASAELLEQVLYI